MNQQGNIVFAARVNIGTQTDYGTFRWDDAAQRLTAVALPGMPAVNNLTFAVGGGQTPMINNENEIALVGQIKNAAGASLPGVFFLGRDGQLQPVALPDQELPDGSLITEAFIPSLSDAGAVAFFARRSDQRWASPYVWEAGTLTPLPTPGSEASGGRVFAGVTAVRLNSANRSALVAAHFEDNLEAIPIFGNSDAFDVLYRFRDGQFTPLVRPGQPMPGGGVFKGLQYGPGAGFASGVSVANGAGQHAFLALLEDGTTAAYRIDADGKVSLVLKSGDLTDLGEIENVGQGGGSSSGVGLNNQGEVAVTVRIAGDADTIVRVTPRAP
jgi:hypothetical protein